MNSNRKIKVAQFGLGPIGISSLRLLAKKNWVEIVGGIDIRPELLDKKLSQLVGEDALGTAKVYDSFEALSLEQEVDVVDGAPRRGAGVHARARGAGAWAGRRGRGGAVETIGGTRTAPGGGRRSLERERMASRRLRR